MIYHFFLEENTARVELSFNMYMHCIPFKKYKEYETAWGIALVYHI